MNSAVQDDKIKVVSLRIHERRQTNAAGRVADIGSWRVLVIVKIVRRKQLMFNSRAGLELIEIDIFRFIGDHISSVVLYQISGFEYIYMRHA